VRRIARRISRRVAWRIAWRIALAGREADCVADCVADRPLMLLLCHLPRWHHPYRGIRCDAPFMQLDGLLQNCPGVSYRETPLWRVL
jgi:hypothetical protein